MSKSDLRARPIYHHKRESIEAHLSIVMAALAVGRLVEQATGWSINRFVKALRPCRTITSQAGDQTVTAADPIPDDALQALAELRRDAAHQIGKSQVKYQFKCQIGFSPVREWLFQLNAFDKIGGLTPWPATTSKCLFV
jgi:hypothetical protein